MIRASLNTSSAISGDILGLDFDLQEDIGEKGAQVEIFDVAVKNPVSKLGFGSKPKLINDSLYQIDIDTKHLQVGVYEVKLIRIHNDEGIEPPIYADHVSGINFNRIFFEVVENPDDAKDEVTLTTTILRIEKTLESEFLKALDIRVNKSNVGQSLCVLVFIKSLLTGTRIKFNDFELIPTGKGVDEIDQLNFVNNYLATNTRINANFSYEEPLRNRAQSLNAVSIMHFPSITADNNDQARNYCVEIAELMISALSLTRGASGEIFEVVVYNPTTGQSGKYAERGNYVGNYLTGSMAGEKPDSLNSYLETLKNSPLISL